MRFLEANYQGNEILTARKGALGLIALNRPRVLNSLSHEMVVDFGKALNAFETDPQVAAVLVTGEGERGLCAGGDIRMFYESGKAGDGKASAFLRAEYRLNARIARSAKPYIVVMDGITMGGGVGVSSHGSHRIVTETTKLAMPETGIGFFPDIGASWLLSRAPGELGTWMGLTGEAINGADAISAGFADWFVPHDRIAELLGKLAKLPLPALGQTIASTIRDFTVDGPTGPFCEGRQLIDRCFSFDTVEEIVAALERETSELAAKTLVTRTLAAMRAKSPTSLKVTLRMLREARRSKDLETCLEREFAGTLQVVKVPDFYEGIRAAIIDKDRNPKWSPARLEDVAPQSVEAFFTEKDERLFG
ncbi:Enoyl-CoA hydratase/isomerase [Rhizobium sp. PDO1-076]|uniref:enoyl-CoA hydratase/isomerase family protein n=1 Tax=Rhizobium sp. PDO1-076 TaxID=1125979 RepID=UPI00024E38EB|nr:enoyl-CoA hydratase/isomerase family protein [Rhizobium sp. PDO1-076]EHS53345.1 Enoyl-CoA hydratase/isomerase [Rhizobium sp. PDO1-076]